MQDNSFIIAEFIRYNNWANDEILKLCEPLQDAELQATAPGTYGTLRETIAHMIWAQVSYIQRLKGSVAEPSFSRNDNITVSQWRAYAAVVGDALLEVIINGNPTDLVREEEDDNFFEYLAQGLWMQVVLHGVEHRTNITTILEQLKRRPPELELDAWGYMSNHREKYHWKAGKTNG